MNRINNIKITDRTIAIGMAASKIGHTCPSAIILPYHVYFPIAVEIFAYRVSDVGIQIVFLSVVV